MTKSGKKCLLFHFNFSPVVYKDFRSGVPCPGTYTEIFNNSRRGYGGEGLLNETPIPSEPVAWDYQENSIQYDLPAFGMVAFQFDYVPPKKSKAKGRRARKSNRRKAADKGV